MRVKCLALELDIVTMAGLVLSSLIINVQPHLLVQDSPQSRFSLTLSLPRVLSSKLKKKIFNFILQNCQKYTAPHEITAQ